MFVQRISCFRSTSTRGSTGFRSATWIPARATPRPRSLPPARTTGRSAVDREHAAHESLARIGDSFRATIATQTAEALANVRRGFFLAYICTFNEWHEGTQFEPMLDSADLAPDQRALGYHNPTDGALRLSKLKELLTLVLQPPAD